MRNLIFFLFIFLNLINLASAKEKEKKYCSDYQFCIIYKSFNDHVLVFFQNPSTVKEAVSTVTFEAKLENMQSDKNFPLTLEIKGNEPVPVACFNVLDLSKKWSYNVFYNYRYGSRNAVHKDQYAYQLPYLEEKSFRVLQGYHGKTTHFGEFEYAVDFDMPEGETILAARDGIVLAVEDRYSTGGFKEEYKTKGNFVILLHSDGTFAEYNHLRQKGVLVQPGQMVKAGDKIGFSGNTGYSLVPHLHFQVAKPVDGRKIKTLPMFFSTSFSQRETVEEANAYFHPGAKKSVLGVKEIRLCKSEGENPKDCKTVFKTKDSVSVFIPIHRLGVYEIKVIFKKANSQDQSWQASWKTEKNWWHTYHTIDLEKYQEAQGTWVCEVYLGIQKVREIIFEVK